MNALLPRDTRELLSKHLGLPDGRSLLADRYATPGAKEDERRKWFEIMASKAASSHKVKGWTGAIARTIHGVLYAQLQSRLMINMAGGVMENAGMCIDRFGVPFVPGSAVKGCARRMATQHLLEAEGAEAKTQLLVSIAQVFGWGDTDWKGGRKTKRKNGREVETEPHSDFWWAMAEDSGDHTADSKREELWRDVARAVASALLERMKIRTCKHPGEPWKDLPNLAGTVSFLPAYPVDVTGAQLPLTPPLLGKLELDVVTCHHSFYYRGEQSVATDDEPPNPVIFPAVAPGHVFNFPLAPLRNCPPDLMRQARDWLALGLSTFGLGAKTAAGYGWFDSSKSVNDTVAETLARREQLELERKQQERLLAEQKAKDEAERRRKEAAKAAMASMTPEQQEDFKVTQLTDDQFRSALDNFAKKSVEEQKAVVRALRASPETKRSRRRFWEDLKQKAAKKGGKLAQTEQTIRTLSRQMFPGKEGKMP